MATLEDLPMELHLKIAENVLSDQNRYELVRNTLSLALVSSHWARVVIDGLRSESVDKSQSYRVIDQLTKEVRQITKQQRALESVPQSRNFKNSRTSKRREGQKEPDRKYRSFFNIYWHSFVDFMARHIFKHGFFGLGTVTAAVEAHVMRRCLDKDGRRGGLALIVK